jgi:uncharacterized protein YgiM (DUF1202 family)
MALSDKVLNEFLAIGKWSTIAEDNIAGEMFTQSFFKEIYDNWVADPNKQENTNAIGLFSLGLSISGWGISDTNGLPDDADDRGWKGTSSTSTGKHLMSYAKGGVGIPHADSSFLQKIIEEIKTNHKDIAPKFDQFYALKGTNFDKLYANGGHCTSPVSTIMTDLEGNAFGHTKFGNAGSSYCATYNTKATTVEDWQVFRHWIRAALRTKAMQSFILDYWIGHYWQPSYEKTMAAGGSISEALINTRIRNSGSVKANANIGKSISDQLKDYGKDRRWGVMLRSANMWEANAGLPISRKPGEASLPPVTTATATPKPKAPPSTPTSILDNITDNTTSDASTTGEVTASSLNIRSAASAGASTVAPALPKGTTVEILDTSDDGGWYHVKIADGTTGWVSARYISSSAKTGKVTASSLNIRSEASGTANTVAPALPKGTEVEILGTSDDGSWYNVKTADGTVGWVSAQYVDV